MQRLALVKIEISWRGGPVRGIGANPRELGLAVLRRLATGKCGQNDKSQHCLHVSLLDAAGSQGLDHLGERHRRPPAYGVTWNAGSSNTAEYRGISGADYADPVLLKAPPRLSAEDVLSRLLKQIAATGNAASHRSAIGH